MIFRKIGEAEDDGEVDFMIYVNHAKYELRCNSKPTYKLYTLFFFFDIRNGCPETAIIYLNHAIGLKPETSLPFLVRSECLNL